MGRVMGLRSLTLTGCMGHTSGPPPVPCLQCGTTHLIMTAQLLTNTHTHTHTHTHTQTHAHTQTGTHKCTHTDAHTQTHTHTHTLRLGPHRAHHCLHLFSESWLLIWRPEWESMLQFVSNYCSAQIGEEERDGRQREGGERGRER